MSMPAGQGVWVARMAAELGAEATLCGFDRRRDRHRAAAPARPPADRAAPGRDGGRQRQLHARPAQRRAGADRTERQPPPSRHEIDDLFSVTLRRGTGRRRAGPLRPLPGRGLPLELYGNLVADVRDNGTPVVVDLSPPRLDSALEGKPNLVKINDWELARLHRRTGRHRRRYARCRRAAARARRRGGDHHPGRATGARPARREAWTLAPPRFERGAREGCGDSMMGAPRRLHGHRPRLGGHAADRRRAPAPPTSCATGSAAPTARSSRTWHAGSSCASSTSSGA